MLQVNLKETYYSVVNSYTKDSLLTESLWKEIESHYSAKGRHYHDLRHLEHLLAEVESCKSLIYDRDRVLFALFYHDIIYKATAKDNEEKSADAAVLALSRIGLSPEKIEKCRAIILATKSHAVSPDNDTNLFTDADLSILGSDREEYSRYFKNVRKEYSVYPDLLYNPGRKKVLMHFLGMENIFKTEFFREKYEERARENLKNEIRIL